MDTRLGWMVALGGRLFVSGFIVRSVASTHRAPTLPETMHQMIEEERSA
jgi:hypothetical protein